MRKLLLLAVCGLVGVPALPLIPVTAQEEQDKQEDKQKVKRHPDLITLAEIQERPDLQTAYDAVRKLRSGWLRVRKAGFSDPSPIQVYVDGMKLGSIDVLRNIAVSSVQELRHMSGTDATTRFGIDHGSGAILVKTSVGAPDRSDGA